MSSSKAKGLMWPRVEFLPHPPDSDTVQPHQHHRCSSQSRVFNTVAVQMADDVAIRTRQIMAIEFLGTESSSPIDIHGRLRSMYGGDAIDISSVRRWVRRFKSSEEGIGDRPRSASAKSFTWAAYSVSRKGGKSLLIMMGTLWKNNPSFVNDVPTIKYMRKFLYNCHNSLWEKKYEALLSCHTSYCKLPRCAVRHNLWLLYCYRYYCWYSFCICICISFVTFIMLIFWHPSFLHRHSWGNVVYLNTLFRNNEIRNVSNLLFRHPPGQTEEKTGHFGHWIRVRSEVNQVLHWRSTLLVSFPRWSVALAPTVFSALIILEVVAMGLAVTGVLWLPPLIIPIVLHIYSFIHLPMTLYKLMHWRR